jgi:uncharacterized membrane protein YjgN (DUF898 family)
MKNYFKFNLTGQKLLPAWLLFLVLFIVPYLLIIYKLKNIQPGHPKTSIIITAVILVLIFIAFIISFFIEKLIIESIEHKNTSLVFNGKLWKFMGIILLEGALSIITIGFYLPWFIKNIQKFFIGNSTYNSHNPKFQGIGGSLFVILTLTLILPIVVVSLLWGLFAAAHYNQLPILYKVLYQVFLLITLIPYIYFVYKWAIEIKLKDYTVSWETNFWQSSAKIFSQIFLSVITLGIYSPLATLHLYKYFAERTIARSKLSHKSFGYDIEPLDDFLFIWGQTLLTIITLGIYFPWAFCKIRSRVFSKTYSEEIQLALS